MGFNLLGRLSKSSISKEYLATQSRRVDGAIENLERGTLPEFISNRIEKERRENLPWTSDLSVQGWLLLKKFKLEPLGMVMGSATYHAGLTEQNLAYQATNIYSSGEMPEIATSMYKSRELALDRLQQEAALMGAHAVVSVRLEQKHHSLETNQIEYTAFGTAVRLADQPLPKHPTICTVSVSDFVKCLQAGAVPVGLAMGIGVYYKYTDQYDNWSNQSWYNQELPSFTEATQLAKQMAVQNMREEVRQAGGTGVLAHSSTLEVYPFKVVRNNNFSGQSDEREDHLLEFVSMGSIIASTNTFKSPKVKTVLNLN